MASKSNVYRGLFCAIIIVLIAVIFHVDGRRGGSRRSRRTIVSPTRSTRRDSRYTDGPRTTSSPYVRSTSRDSPYFGRSRIFGTTSGPYVRSTTKRSRHSTGSSIFWTTPNPYVRSTSKDLGLLNPIDRKKNSSPYTRSTFQAALTAGAIYGGDRYMKSSRYRSNPDMMPTICTNNYEADDNGTTYGYFICPRAGEPEDYEYCCGSARRERCCDFFDAFSHRQVPSGGLNSGQIVGIVTGSLIGVVFLMIISRFICILRNRMKKNAGTTVTYTTSNPTYQADGDFINDESKKRDTTKKYSTEPPPYSELDKY